MIKRKNGGRVSRYRHEASEDVNPMDSTGNLADAMLVLAVEIMLALIMNWNVDLSQFVDLDDVNTSDLSEEQVDEVEEDKALQEKGMVYQDPATGKYYIKVEK